MSEAPIELIQVRIATPGWTPGKKDISSLFAVWRDLEDSERDAMVKRLTRLDAPSIKRASELFFDLDERSRGELARPLLKSFLKYFESSELLVDSPWLMDCFKDQSARVRKSAAQALGSSWEDVKDLKNKKKYVQILIDQLEITTDSSELKALSEALGKCGDERALQVLKQTSFASSKAKLSLERDVIRAQMDSSSVSDERTFPERLDSKGLVAWFTPGIEVLAQSQDLFRSAKTIKPHVLMTKDVSWPELASSPLWRRAGIAVGQLEQVTPQSLAALMKSCSDSIIKATKTSSKACPRLRVGRYEWSSRSFIWSFAEELSKLNCGLLNDGRQAHWDIMILGGLVVLVPLMTSDDRFLWKDVSIDGASDPSIAAAIVNMANIKSSDVVYDPFCGGGTELILAGLNHRGATLHGTDLDDVVLERAYQAAQSAGVKIQFSKVNALSDSLGQIDVLITNPPFGIRTARGEARHILQDFLLGLYRRLSPGARVVMLSHAPNSTIEWATAGRLSFVRGLPIQLGKMPCELQQFVFKG